MTKVRTLSVYFGDPPPPARPMNQEAQAMERRVATGEGGNRLVRAEEYLDTSGHAIALVLDRE